MTHDAEASAEHVVLRRLRQNCCAMHASAQFRPRAAISIQNKCSLFQPERTRAKANGQRARASATRNVVPARTPSVPRLPCCRPLPLPAAPSPMRSIGFPAHAHISLPRPRRCRILSGQWQLRAGRCSRPKQRGSRWLNVLERTLFVMCLPVLATVLLVPVRPAQASGYV